MEEMIHIGDSVRQEGTKSWGFVTDVYGQYCTILWHHGVNGKKLVNPIRQKVCGNKLEVIKHIETGYTDPIPEDIRPRRRSYYERERDLW